MSTPGKAIQQLKQQGQSVWLDYIRRGLMKSGELERLVRNNGISGVTSNPAIFHKAIAGSDEYDNDLRMALDKTPDASPLHLYETIAVKDVQLAADILRPVYDASDGADGFISLEVSPKSAADTQKTISEARHLWETVDRPNVMIKVPATSAGIPAIETLIAEGINVNVTLLFSLRHYERVAHAYLRGLERSQTPHNVASVASFFVSRVDTMVDAMLAEMGSEEALALQGRIGIATARRIYQEFRHIFQGERFSELRRRGAKVQRPLWASTGTKNPDYSDVIYIEELIGSETVNTMPPATLTAFRHHGRVRAATIEENVAAAQAAVEQLNKLGIDIDSVAEQLQEEGLRKFTEPFEKLLTALEQKKQNIQTPDITTPVFTIGDHFEQSVKKRMDQWSADNIACRLWQKDPTVWFTEKQPEIVDRLGWLDLPAGMHDQLDDICAFAEGVRKEGIRDVVLLGMGGSSLAPEVYQRTFGNAAGYPELHVLDSTHPTAVTALQKKLELTRTLFIVSSKSGTTTEPLSFMYYFWRVLADTVEHPDTHFVAITDPGTHLEKLGKQHKFRRVFRAPPDIGGRYSALSVFGLVPAALIGMDLHRYLDLAWTFTERCSFCSPGDDNPGLHFGAVIGELARAGRNKLTFVTSAALRAFPDWAEQLVAESTGKDGTGIVPVVGEDIDSPENYCDDRVFVQLKLHGEEDREMDRKLSALRQSGQPVIQFCLPDAYYLSQEMFRWELAIATASIILGVHPFNQPNVELAKKLAKQAMQQQEARTAGQTEQTFRIDDIEQFNREIRNRAAAVDSDAYLSLQAYLAPSDEADEVLQQVRRELRQKTGKATTIGYGPRFLHSTGQLHKGGPKNAFCLQIVDEPCDPVPVPTTDYTFRELIHAQASGDYNALAQSGQPVLRLNLGNEPLANLRLWLSSFRS